MLTVPLLPNPSSADASPSPWLELEESGYAGLGIFDEEEAVGKV